MDMGVYKVAAEMWGDKQDEDGGQQMLQNSWKQMISTCIQKEVIVYLMTSTLPPGQVGLKLELPKN